MAKTFFPHSEKVVYVNASSPHPDNTQYKISLGVEVFGGGRNEVAKVQMVYNGNVAGRRSPSYPIGTDDFHRVSLKIQELIANR